MGLVASSALSVGAVLQLGNSAELLRCSCSLAVWHCLSADCGSDSWSVKGRRELEAKGTQGVNSFALTS